MNYKRAIFLCNVVQWGCLAVQFSIFTKAVMTNRPVWLVELAFLGAGYAAWSLRRKA